MLCVFVGCAVDTGTSVSLDEQKKQTTRQETPSSSSVLYQYVSSSSSMITYKSTFPTDLAYVGINKKSNGANLVMKNNTTYKMAVKVNYTISCSINGKPAQTTSKTQAFSFDMYEQKESSSSVDGIWHGGMTTIECTGTITSIVPDIFDKSNFQAWTGTYPISTK